MHKESRRNTSNPHGAPGLPISAIKATQETPPGGRAAGFPHAFFYPDCTVGPGFSPESAPVGSCDPRRGSRRSCSPLVRRKPSPPVGNWHFAMPHPTLKAL